MSDTLTVRELVPLDHADEKFIAIACTPDGSIVAVNDIRGQVSFYAVDKNGQPGTPLPLRLSVDEVRGVLLHPDGRVISFRYEADALRIDFHDPRTAALLCSLVIGPIEVDELDGDLGERPSPEEGYHFDVAILASRPLLDSLLPMSIAIAPHREPPAWEPTLLDELAAADVYPNRFTRMALHPNQRWLAVLDRGTWVIDLESGELLRTLPYWLPWMLEDSGTHTIGFDDQGRVTIASTVISGNPFVSVDHIDVESGVCEASIEVWQQRYQLLSQTAVEINIHDHCPYFPPAQIPVASYKVLFRRCGIELWSASGLVRGVLLEAQTCVIPAFDPGSFCTDPHALLITSERIELVDLVTGERTRVQPPIGEPPQTSTLSRIELDPTRRRLLLWREGSALLSAWVGDDRWSLCELPEGRQMREWALAGDRGRVFVVDDAGELWFADVDLEPQPTASRAGLALHTLEDDLLAEPHEPGPFLVFADALNDRGDPWGELIVLQHQRAFDEAYRVFERHRHALLGPLAELDSYGMHWERGFVRTAKLTIREDQLSEVLAFLASARARLLESLELHVHGHRVLGIYAQVDEYLAAARHLPLLRSLQLGAPGEYTASFRVGDERGT